MTNINFPDSPSDGEIFGERRYNATKGVWEDYVLPGDTTAADLLLPGQSILYSVEYLVIAGGGGASGLSGAGAGGYRSSVSGESSGGGQDSETPLFFTAGDYAVTVGAGGPEETQGSNSVFENVVSVGGGRATGDGGGSGGSGGGGHPPSPGGSGTEGQGYKGGDAAANISPYYAGGGGGAGEPGGNGDTATRGVGGDGVASSVTGSSVYRAGGGAGSDISQTAYDGGLGGGATSGGGGTGDSGINNTGGGGAAGGGGAGRGGGAGGSGVVIFKISSAAAVSFGSGLTEANGGSGQTVGDYKVYTVTAGTGTVTIS